MDTPSKKLSEFKGMDFKIFRMDADPQALTKWEKHGKPPRFVCKVETRLGDYGVMVTRDQWGNVNLSYLDLPIG